MSVSLSVSVCLCVSVCIYASQYMLHSICDISRCNIATHPVVIETCKRDTENRAQQLALGPSYS